MVETVVIPLSALNNFPGISEVEDVEFDVPQLDEIVADVEDALPDLDSIEDAVDRNVPDIDEIVEDVVEGVEEAIDDIDVPGIDEDQLVEDVVDGIEIDLPDSFPTVQDIVDGVVSELEGGIEATGIDPEEIGQAIAAEVEDVTVEEPAVSIDGVFGPLTQDIVRAFNEVLGARLDEEGIDLPSVEDVRTAVREEVEEVLETVPGSDLLFDPDQFVDDQIARLTDGLVSDETRQEAAEAFGEDS